MNYIFFSLGIIAWSGMLDLMIVFCSVISVQFTQSCPTLCDPMNCSMPGLPVHHQLLESTQTHVHQVDDAIQPSHPLSPPSLPALNLSQHLMIGNYSFTKKLWKTVFNLLGTILHSNQPWTGVSVPPLCHQHLVRSSIFNLSLSNGCMVASHSVCLTLTHWVHHLGSVALVSTLSTLTMPHCLLNLASYMCIIKLAVLYFFPELLSVKV